MRDRCRNTFGSRLRKVECPYDFLVMMRWFTFLLKKLCSAIVLHVFMTNAIIYLFVNDYVIQAMLFRFQYLSLNFMNRLCLSNHHLRPADSCNLSVRKLGYAPHFIRLHKVLWKKIEQIFSLYLDWRLLFKTGLYN